ncbi:MAG: MerR family transcriptional regulator [Syntrophomonas sp.]
MEKQLKIGEYAKLTGVTIKTVLHYHKMGLLVEAKRSAGGYRLYGVADLNRMRSIKRLKYLGLSLEQIKGILGEPDDYKSVREVLLAMQNELLNQIKTLTGRVEKIQTLLQEEQENLLERTDESPSFKMVVDILGEEAREQYLGICPEIYEQERKLYEVIDDLDWGVEYEDILREVAEYFRDNPDKYHESLAFGTKITAIAELLPNSPAVEELAREYAEFIMGLPFYQKLISHESGLQKSLDSLWRDMFAEVYSPAQIKFVEMLGEYLESGKGSGPSRE